MAAAASATKDTDTEAASAETAKPAGRSRRMLLLVAPLLLAGLLAGLWFSGVLPRLLGMSHAAKHEAAAPMVPVYVDLPEIVANLNSLDRRPSYVKLSVRLEVQGKEDADRVHQVLPRIQDLFQTYLREMRPEELRGSAGTYRLREELLTRANIAVAPARIHNILFVQMLIQ